MIHAATELGATADHLTHRAAEILAPPSITPAHGMFCAVSALLATTHGYNAEHRITPDEIDWATTHGGTLHIIEYADGNVTFTKNHRDECSFITSGAARNATTGATSNIQPTRSGIHSRDPICPQ